MTELIDELKNEILWVLFALHTIERRTKSLLKASCTQLDLAENLILLEALTQQVVLRLCRLDDDQNKAKWFRRVTKYMEAKHEPQDRIKKANALIKKYRDDIQHLKIYHRNKYIGHLQEAESATPKTPFFPPKIKEATDTAIALVDILANEQVTYKFRPGSHSQVVSLRPSE